MQDNLTRLLSLLHAVKEEMRDTASVGVIQQLDEAIAELELLLEDSSKADTEIRVLALEAIGKFLYSLPSIVELIKFMGG